MARVTALLELIRNRSPLVNTGRYLVEIVNKQAMEIVNPCCSVMSNFEVMETLSKQADTKKKYGLRNLATISYEALQYLEDSACKHQSRQSIMAFLSDAHPYNLTKKECVMIVNDPPTAALHIQLLIEDSEERLSEEQVSQLLEITKRHFPGPPPESN